MIARASDKVAKSLRVLAIWNLIIAPLVFAKLILLSVRIDRFIHPERLPLRKDIQLAGRQTSRSSRETYRNERRGEVEFEAPARRRRRCSGA
jgi:hypothetical protein